MHAFFSVPLKYPFLRLYSWPFFFPFPYSSSFASHLLIAYTFVYIRRLLISGFYQGVPVLQFLKPYLLNPLYPFESVPPPFSPCSLFLLGQTCSMLNPGASLRQLRCFCSLVLDGLACLPQ